jgi:hypothetical protein
LSNLLAKCPQCQGANVEPRGDEWWCMDCNAAFPLAAVEETEADEEEKKPE